MALPSALSATQLLEAMEGVAWLTDPAGAILAVGQRNWSLFAIDNGAPELTADAVVGRSLFAAIQGDDVQTAYHRMHIAVASGRRVQSIFEYRCDSPIAERHMRMSISGVSNTGQVLAVLYQSQIIEERIRTPLPLFEWRERRMPEHAPVVAVCAFCQRVQWPVGDAAGRRRWIAAADYYRRGGPDDAAVQSGVCPRCEGQMRLLAADD